MKICIRVSVLLAVFLYVGVRISICMCIYCVWENMWDIVHVWNCRRIPGCLFLTYCSCRSSSTWLPPVVSEVTLQGRNFPSSSCRHTTRAESCAVKPGGSKGETLAAKGLSPPDSNWRWFRPHEQPSVERPGAESYQCMVRINPFSNSSIARQYYRM